MSVSAFENYFARMNVRGSSKREAIMRNAKGYYLRNMASSPSYYDVLIDGTHHGVTIHNEDNLKYKTIAGAPNDTLKHGGLVEWNNGVWLIFEKDFNDELYPRARMQQCNYVLKWINNDGKIVEKWCIVEDGTKYLVGERDEGALTVGDARIAITITRDADTKQIARGRRFLVDDPEGSRISAYEVTKLNRLYNVYQNDGVYRYILGERDLTDNDNTDLMIADYFSWKPDTVRERVNDNSIPVEDIVLEVINEQIQDENTEVWI